MLLLFVFTSIFCPSYRLTKKKDIRFKSWFYFPGSVGFHKEIFCKNTDFQGICKQGDWELWGEVF